jgi:hypothetical protein
MEKWFRRVKAGSPAWSHLVLDIFTVMKGIAEASDSTSKVSETPFKVLDSVCKVSEVLSEVLETIFEVSETPSEVSEVESITSAKLLSGADALVQP